jgi:hypothetical protein
VHIEFEQVGQHLSAFGGGDFKRNFLRGDHQTSLQPSNYN